VAAAWMQRAENSGPWDKPASHARPYVHADTGRIPASWCVVLFWTTLLFPWSIEDRGACSVGQVRSNTMLGGIAVRVQCGEGEATGLPVRP
jgi:hypothetical protein